MKYDVIILGATFTAAGIAEVLGDKCLIVERRPQAGYEYFNALNFGTDYDQELTNDISKQLLEEFKKKNAFVNSNINLFNCADVFYSYLNKKNVLLNTEIISVENGDDGFTVKTHGVSGYRTFKTDKVIDTRVPTQHIKSKSLNFLVNDRVTLALDNVDTIDNWGHEGDTVIKCFLPTDSNYITARKVVANVIKSLPDEQKVMFVADMFDIKLNSDYPSVDGNITLIPSNHYSNPILSFDAGVSFAKELSL